MSSNGSETKMEIDCTPLDLRSDAKLEMKNLHPAKSEETYMKVGLLELCALKSGKKTFSSEHLKRQQVLNWLSNCLFRGLCKHRPRNNFITTI